VRDAYTDTRKGECYDLDGRRHCWSLSFPTRGILDEAMCGWVTIGDSFALNCQNTVAEKLIPVFSRSVPCQSNSDFSTIRTALVPPKANELDIATRSEG
jgi:hypothetical protein